MNRGAQLPTVALLVAALSACGGGGGGGGGPGGDSTGGDGAVSPEPVAAEPVAIVSGSETCIELEQTTITQDTTIGAGCYRVSSDIDVSDAATLTLLAGARFEFAAGVEMAIKQDGRLVVSGSADAPVVMTGAMTTPGYWDGVHILSVAPSEMTFAVIEYAGSHFGDANISVAQSGRLRLSDSTVRHSSTHGVNVIGKNARLLSLSNSTVTANGAAPLQLSADNASVIAADNTLTGNVAETGISADYVLLERYSDIESEQSWADPGVPYRFENPSTEVTAPFSVAPGVTLEFMEGTRLAVKFGGKLDFKGTAEQPILLTGTAAAAGHWHGLHFSGSKSENHLEHVIVEYAGAPYSTSEGSLAVFGVDSQLSLKHVDIRYGQTYGFYFDNPLTLTMDNVNVTGHAIAGSMAFSNAGALDRTSSFNGNANNTIELGYGDVDADMLLAAVGVTYEVQRPIDINALLSVEPGVEVLFTSTAHWHVNDTGVLQANGTPEAPIRLAGVEPVPGLWRGIRVMSASPDNRLNYVSIENAGDGELHHTFPAALGFYHGAQGSVTNTSISGSLGVGLVVGSDMSGVFDNIEFADIALQDVLVR